MLFGLGQTAESIKNFAFGTLLLLYYNQVLGVSGTLSGIAVAIALAVDAISDPAVGSLSDGFRHRLGRRHLFMFASIVPLALCYFLLFWPPAGLGEFGLFVWLTIFAVLTRTALTFFHVPYIALGAEMSLNYQERTQIAAIRQAVGMLGSLVVVWLTWNVVMVASPDVSTPQLTREPYFEFALMSALIMGGFMLISAFGTMSVRTILSDVQSDHPEFTLRRVYADIYTALQNKSFLALFWGTLIFAIFHGVHTALSMHTKTFFWELDTVSIEYIQYASVAGGVLGLLAIGVFHRVFDKRMTLIIGVILFTCTQTIPITLHLAGLMPTDPMILRWLLVSLQAIGYVGIIHASVSSVSMMGDLTDEHELVHGRRQEGVYFGSFNFALKCTTAAGNLIAGFGLDLVSFPENATPGQVPMEILSDYGLFSISLVVLAFVGIWVFWPYNMLRARHNEVLAKLRARNVPETSG